MYLLFSFWRVWRKLKIMIFEKRLARQVQLCFDKSSHFCRQKGSFCKLFSHFLFSEFLLHLLSKSWSFGSNWYYVFMQVIRSWQKVIKDWEIVQMRGSSRLVSLDFVCQIITGDNINAGMWNGDICDGK